MSDQEAKAARLQKILADDTEKERIIRLSDEAAWQEASADFIGDQHEVFSQMVITMCERTEVSFWRNFLRMKKRVVQVHAVHQFSGDDYPAALARCWLWHKQFEKGRNQSTL